jgi:hypothetical protein
MARVPEMLREGADTYEQRNELYGDNYHNFGRVMMALFPRGVSCDSVDDYNRLGIIVQMVGKLGRYCEQFEKGGHDDSLLDLAVYSQMLRELDEEARNNQELPF